MRGTIGPIGSRQPGSKAGSCFRCVSQGCLHNRTVLENLCLTARLLHLHVCLCVHTPCAALSTWADDCPLGHSSSHLRLLAFFSGRTQNWGTFSYKSERQRSHTEINRLVVHSPECSQCCGWVGRKPGAQTSPAFPKWVAGIQLLNAITCCLPECTLEGN